MTPLTIALSAGLGFCLTLALTALVLVLRLNKSHDQLLQRVTSLTQQLKRTQLSQEEIRTAEVGMGERLLQLEQSLDKLAEQQQEMEQEIVHQDPESRLYTRALKMVELGADMEEVMRECELPRAEAELLFTMHRQPG